MNGTGNERSVARIERVKFLLTDTVVPSNEQVIKLDTKTNVSVNKLKVYQLTMNRE